MCVRLSCLKPMQVLTTNYRHLCSPVNPLMPRVNKKSYLKFQVCLSDMYDLLLLPDIKVKINLYRS